MKKIVVVNYNSIIPDLSGHFDVLPPDVLPEMDALVVWNDAVGDARAAADFARSIGVPVIVVGHGWYTTPISEYAERGVKPEPGTYHILWSESDRELFVKDGVNPDRVSVVGSPLYDLRVPKRVSGPTVLYAPVHADDHVDGKLNTSVANDIWTTLSRMEGIRPFMKLCRNEHLPASIDPRLVYTDRTSPDHVRQLFRILAQTAVVVTHDEGTFSLLAYLMDIPVIKVKSHYAKVTDACEEVEPADLEAAVRDALKDPSRRAAERKAVVEKAGGPVSESHLVKDRIVRAINRVFPVEQLQCV